MIIFIIDLSVDYFSVNCFIGLSIKCQNVVENAIYKVIDLKLLILSEKRSKAQRLNVLVACFICLCSYENCPFFSYKPCALMCIQDKSSWHIFFLCCWYGLSSLDSSWTHERPLLIDFVFSVLLLCKRVHQLPSVCSLDISLCPLLGFLLLFACLFSPRVGSGWETQHWGARLKRVLLIFYFLIRLLVLTYPLPSQVSVLSLTLSIYLNFLNPFGHTAEVELWVLKGFDVLIC